MKELVLFCVGLNHQTAPLEVREKLAYDEYQVRAALAHKSGANSCLKELLLLSTCNRTEFYAASNGDAISEIESLFAETRALNIEQIRPYLFHYQRFQVVQHLFEVACGLNSQVIGEPQILGQITRALELARGAGTAGPLLNRLFLAAIHSGKRARTETTICRNSSSISSLAASLAENLLSDLSQARTAILGAGETAELTIEALRRRGTQHITVVNRTLKRASELALRWNAELCVYEDLMQVLNSADVIIASTGAPHTIITRDMLLQAGLTRINKPLLLIDIAVPRDVDPQAADLPFVHLYDLDDLNQQLESCYQEKEAEVPKVREILNQECENFQRYLRSLEILPIISQLHKQAEEIRKAEMEKTLRHLSDLNDEEKKHIEALTRALVKKILAAPTQTLRGETNGYNTSEIAAFVRTLFSLHEYTPNKETK